jgi:single-stranded-DNA-specific exonuclease
MNKTSTVIEFKDSIIGNEWQINEPNCQLIERIKNIYSLDEIIIKILLNRNITETYIGSFLDKSLKNNMPDPNILMDMQKATNRIAKAIQDDEVIGIIGDYDVDGIVSASILCKFISLFNKNVIVKIPDRIKDGYGPNEEIIKELNDKNVSLIITVDCGANASDILKSKAEIDFIILDHHQANEISDKYFAHVNPNRVDDISGLHYLSAAGVVFLTLVSINRSLRDSGFYNKDTDEINLLMFLPLVALATVADVVPQIGLNRSFVGQGLKLFNKYINIGINSIIKINNKQDEISCSDLGYFIGPRINAGGRIGQSSLGFDLLTTEDPIVGEKIAIELDKLNSERKLLEEKAVEEALEMFDVHSEKNDNLIFLKSDNWHLGVIGLISSRITNRYHKPSFVISSKNEDNIYTGSARSIGNFNIGQFVEQAVKSKLLISGGGHRMAAGFKIHSDNIEKFKLFLLNQNNKISNSRKILRVDGLLMASAVNINFIEKILELGPYGNSFEEPLFIFPGHRINNLVILKNQHLKFSIQDENNYKLDSISFRSYGLPLGDFICENVYKKINFLGRLSLNKWGANIRPQLIIDDASIIQ